MQATTDLSRPGPSDVTHLDEIVRVSRHLGVAELGEGPNLRGNGGVLNHGDTEAEWGQLFDELKATHGFEFASRIDSVLGNCIAAETQRSYLRGCVHEHSISAGVLLDDDAVTALVDGYVERNG